MRVAGIMSGTSLDGIDVAVVDIEGRRVRTVAFRTTPYPLKLRAGILAVSNRVTHTASISRLNFELGERYARAVKETCRLGRVPLESVELIGCHGQTIYHEGVNTLQIGEAAVIAERTGIPVVSDFRPRDIAAGGQGAPLVPFVDYLLLRDARKGRVALNIGGIANLTAIPAGAEQDDVFAFDTGPGNMVIDGLVAGYTRGRQQYDRGGRIASQGRVNGALIRQLMRNRYYRMPPPKSAGREQYGAEFVERMKRSGLRWPDLIATATVFTAVTIAAGIEKFVKPRMRVDELIVSGGGAHNPRILAHLAGLLPGVAVARTSDFGIDVDAKEALAFAVLAYQTWRRRPGNLPGATGARRPVVLGKITP
ncbi:MAG: anhydro-N-acetylmuramic acid kinase [Bryobacterales bacterium]|nr:anhydro-N-acetylmuramic acid kinase [Bryobacterales bacterium]